MALLVAELVVTVEELVDARAFTGGVRVFADGVYNALPVCAFDPAEEDPDDANEVEAPAPDAPDEAFAWM
jgi:hypothetical protein